MSTHDHFTVDADGDLYFVDRSDDIIKTRGEKVSSVEVENVLHDLDGVGRRRWSACPTSCSARRCARSSSSRRGRR